MRGTDYAVYLGEEIEKGYSGFLADNDFYLILEVKKGLEKEAGRQVILAIKQALSLTKIDSLISLDEFVSSQIKKQNLPAGISLAVGQIVGKIIYLKTVGEGKIFIKRRDKFEKVIDGNQTASGYVEEGDYFIFATSNFVQLFASEEELKKIFDHKTPHQIVEDLAPQIKAGIDQGAIALIVRYSISTVNQSEKEEIIMSQPLLIERGKNYFFNLIRRFTQFFYQLNKKKALNLGLVIILVGILLWSVVFGLIKRNQSRLNQQIKRSRELINQKLDQAEEVAFLNLSRSQALINEAREELANLQEKIGEKNKTIDELKTLIKNREAKIINKEERQAEEFYDLALENKKATGSKLYLNEDNLLILDAAQKNIYRLSLTKKSLEKINDSKIASARLLAGYQEKIFFLVEDKGLYQATEETKPQLVLKKDRDWEKIVDFWIYNGNLYLLDAEKDKIYKYLAGEEGFGSQSDYFKSGEAIDLEGVNSLSIDSSVYLGFKDYGVKYTAGVRDEFKTVFPEEEVKMVKLYTNKNLEKVYGWDKSKGVIYVLGKNGSYERQIKSSVLTKGSDLVVFKDNAYIIVKEKIYKVNLE